MAAKTDVQKLKQDNSILAVAQEVTRGKMERRGPVWVCSDRPGLEVDAGGSYRWDGQSGDVIAFLRQFYRWTFIQAVRYLESRAIMRQAGEALPEVVPTTAPRAAVVTAMDPWSWEARAAREVERAKNDPDIVQALKVAGKDARMIKDILGKPSGRWKAWSELSGIIPAGFMPYIGRGDGDNLCGFCYQEAKRWSAPGEFYLAVEVAGDTWKLGDSLYCADCVKRFEALTKALDLILGYILTTHTEVEEAELAELEYRAAREAEAQRAREAAEEAELIEWERQDMRAQMEAEREANPPADENGLVSKTGE